MQKVPDALADLPLDHIGIATANLEAAAAAYEQLGLPREGKDETLEAQGVRVRVYRAGESLIELLEPSRQDSPIATFLAKRGPGLHHLALRVRDIDRECARLRQEGAPLLNQTPRPGRHQTRVIFIHPSWAQGVLIELVEYPHGERDSG